MQLKLRPQIFWTLLLLIITQQISAQGLKGTIINSSGGPVPFANIYISDLTRGTTSNIDGKYELKLSPGKYEVSYQYLGYQTQEHTIQIENSFVTKNVVLEEQQYEIPKVVVYADNEDPAYHIMRKAIAMAHYYRNQVKSYDCRVYLKGTGILEEIPALLERKIRKEGIEEGETFITENISDIHFELPNTIKQEVISIRSNQYSENINPMSYINLSLYDEMESPISPLDKRAFNVYKFELVKAYNDKDRFINKIKVIPKRKGYDLFSGFIHIAEDFWNIHSLNLSLEQKMFEVNIKRLYAPVKEEIWMPVSHHFEVSFSGMGFKGTFQYAGSVNYKEIKRNKALDHSFLSEVRDKMIQFQKEKKEVLKEAAKQQKKQNLSSLEKKLSELAKHERLNNREAKKMNRLMKKKLKEEQEKPSLRIEEKMTVVDSARKRPLSYWDSIRPIPLTEIEKKGYKEKDSLDYLMEDPEYRDSVKKAKRKFRLKHLVTGKTYNYEETSSELSFGGLIGLRSFSFNTVDGFLYKKAWDYNKRYDDGRKWWILHKMSYAFARNEFLSHVKFRARYDTRNRGYITLRGGRKTMDFNSSETIPRSVNMLNSLFLAENHIKLYQKDFLKIRNQIDIANGLEFTSSLEYADRQALSNHTKFYLWDPLKNNTYTPNIPGNKHVNATNLSSHNSFNLSGKLSYTPRYFYKIKNNIKRMQYSKYPTFSLKYKGGFPGIINSETKFQYIEGSVDDNRNVSGIGRLDYLVKAGTFLNKDKLYFTDFRHFSTHTPFLASSLSYKDFRLPDYYAYSTNKSFVEGHVKIRNDRILLKRLPYFNQTLMMESLYFHYLKTTGRKNYYEIGYSLEQVFLMFNLEVFAGFKGLNHTYTGFTISLPILSGSQTVRIGG